jgi:hypothetical protein
MDSAAPTSAALSIQQPREQERLFLHYCYGARLSEHDSGFLVCYIMLAVTTRIYCPPKLQLVTDAVILCCASTLLLKVLFKRSVSTCYACQQQSILTILAICCGQPLGGVVRRSTVTEYCSTLNTSMPFLFTIALHTTTAITCLRPLNMHCSAEYTLLGGLGSCFSCM